jgi:hypothetical protein
VGFRNDVRQAVIPLLAVCCKMKYFHSKYPIVQRIELINAPFIPGILSSFSHDCEWLQLSTEKYSLIVT